MKIFTLLLTIFAVNKVFGMGLIPATILGGLFWLVFISDLIKDKPKQKVPPSGGPSPGGSGGAPKPTPPSPSPSQPPTPGGSQEPPRRTNPNQ